ncbi:hypothetical protein [Succinivibrio sp.]|uniref:hypothetical protein n=1 Tax=Succinivibrio sp. TaxID=2053619 RepID=UPI0025E5FEDF|nr:hypothetical protein [Succinivibrio sp.]MBQ9220642.1 hypothetical protein [Succinivibrio sp.]
MNIEDVSNIIENSIIEKKATREKNSRGGILGALANNRNTLEDITTKRLDVVLGDESPYDFLRGVSEHPEAVKKLLKEKGYNKPIIKFKYRLGKEFKSSLYIEENEKK